MHKQKPNKLFFQLALVLTIPLIIITIYSFSDEEITIGDFTLEKAEIAALFRLNTVLQGDSLAVDSTSLSSTLAADTCVTDTAAQRILFFGDSMVEGLSKRMRNYAAENGHELLNVIWYSSSTKIWAQYDTLNHYIRQFEPTYLMLCLGGNELFVRDLDKRDAYIQTIVEKIGDYPYVWIGPPNWKEDTGINDLIEKNVSSQRYFPSKRLTYQRGKDGAHPTVASSAMWMDSIAVWIANESRYRIRMNLPTTQEKHGKTTILSPLK